MTMLSQINAAGGAPANYIEDVFSTWLTTGTGSAQTVVNGINLSTKGGLIWEKLRGPGTQSHSLTDTVRGTGSQLNTNDTGTGTTSGSCITAFNTNGFNFGTAYSGSGDSNVFWTFRKQPKFFDVVTYTGDGTASKLVSHNLQSVPGFIIAKKTSGTGDWIVCNRYSDTNWFGGNSTNNWGLNSTAAAGAGVDPTTRGITSSVVDVAKLYGSAGSFDASIANANGATYVMYLIAHNAGGFGLSGSDSVTYCGGLTVSGGAGTVTLGWEPQLVLLKNADTTGAWYMNDNMRGMPVKDGTNASLYPNTSGAETSGTAGAHPTATGFTVQGVADGTYSFLAIRRGPMKVPTSGTTVYSSALFSGNGVDGRDVTSAINAPDFFMLWDRANSYGLFTQWFAKLAGTKHMISNSTAAEVQGNALQGVITQTGIQYASSGSDTNSNVNGNNYDNFAFARAPSFMDIVCFTGTTNGYLDRLSHNLTVAPELIIVKKRSATNDWYAYCSSLNGGVNPQNYYLYVDGTNAVTTGANTWGAITPNSTTFAFYADNAATYVSYLFATCPGVSKVGSYTGTGTTKQIDCGFTAGARFIMIKRTDSTGDWYVWDSARGIVAGNDPYLLLNSTAAEVTTTDYVDTYAGGFELSSTAPAALNASGGTYIFLAIA